MWPWSSKTSSPKLGKGKPKEDNSDDEGDDNLYNLVRGGKKSSLVIQRLQDEEDFVPTRNLRTRLERVIMMISSDESDSSNYIPKKRKIEKEEEIKEIKNDCKRSKKNLTNLYRIF